MAQFLPVYERLSRLPFGKWLFSKGVAFKAPYFASIGARVQQYRAGYIEATLRDRRAVHNHIGTVHAIALCNLAELCGAMALDSAMPPHLRWIPQGMTVRYLKKARGTMTGRCSVQPAQVREGSVPVQIDVVDPAGERVFTATIDFHVSANRKS